MRGSSSKGEASDELVGQLLDGRYRIEKHLGSGGMGDVYLARQRLIDRHVAIKVLRPARARDPRAIAQFMAEARAVSRLTSPHTVTLLDVGKLDDDTPYLAMEYLEGRTLRGRLQAGPLPLEEAVTVVDAVALSLAEAHERGIVHRDLKPLNVFLARTPGHTAHVKVLDLGLALLDDVKPERALRAAGTPRYMAPEAITGGDVDARADVYALGMLAWELLAGRHPFEDLSGDELVDAQLTIMPAPLEEASSHDLPAEATRLCARALAKPARLRPRDAGAFRDGWRRAFGLATRADEHGDATPAAHGDETLASHTGAPSAISLDQTASQIRRRRVGALGVALGVAVIALMWARAAPERSPVVTTRPAPPPIAPAPSPSSSVPAPPVVSAEVPAVQILVHSVPDGADVRVDGEDRGATPTVLTLPGGRTVTLSLTRSGYLPEEKQVTATESRTLRYVLAPRNARPPTSARDPVRTRVDSYFDE